MIVHRTRRDVAKCRNKYGKAWEKYEREVPYLYIPVRGVSPSDLTIGWNVWQLTRFLVRLLTLLKLLYGTVSRCVIV